VVADVAVEVRDDQVLVVVAQVHHLLLDARRLVVEEDRDDRHQVPVFEALVLELAEEVPDRLTDHFAPTGVAVVVAEFVDPLL